MFARYIQNIHRFTTLSRLISLRLQKQLGQIIINKSKDGGLFSSRFVLFGFVLRSKVSNCLLWKPLPTTSGSPSVRPLRSWDLITSILIFFGVIEDLDKMDPLILAIKRGILAKQRKQYHKADMLLHAALKMAQDVCYTDAETYIFDVMADNCFEKGDFQRAKDLYIEVLSRLSIKENFSYESEEMVEISIKLAYCISRLGEFEPSEKGFHFSMDSQLARTNKFWNNKTGKLIVEGEEVELSDEERNSLALLGMCYDYYSKHLEHQNSSLIKNALAFRLKALQISKVVNGDEHEQTWVLQNDIANLYLHLGEYNQAKKYLRAAIKGAKQSDSADLPMYYLNMASLHCHQNRDDLARPFCQRTLDFLNKSKSAEDIPPKDRKFLEEKSQYCLAGKQFY